MDLKDLLRTNKRYLNILESNGIKTPKDFFEYWPRDYEDRSKIKKVSEIVLDGGVQLVKGKVVEKKLITTPTGKKLVEIILEDSDGIKFFVHYINSVFWLKQFKKNNRYLIIGKPKFEYGKVIFWHPEVKQTISDNDKLSSDKSSSSYDIGRIYPIYSELGGIKSSWFAKKVWENLDKIDAIFEEYYPEDFLKEFDLLEIRKTVRNMHYPDSWDILKKAKERIWFDKLLRIQLISLLNKLEYGKDNRRCFKITEDKKLESIDNITYEIINCAFEVYNRYGPGLREKFYQTQLKKCLENKGFITSSEYSVKTKDGDIVGKVDLVVENKIIIEIKSLPKIIPQNFKQLRTYLQLGNFVSGLLFNFGSFGKLEYYRFNNNISSVISNNLLLSSSPDRQIIKNFIQTLPFQLTKAQKKVIKQIVDDFHSGKTMMRLVQGDVGSGKTIVAISVARYMIKKFGKQVAFLAPTEILAKQHYKNITKFLLPLGIRVELLVGSMTKSQKEHIKQRLKLGLIDFIVGTHAIIQEDVEFKDLGLAIIDEQHRFGVKQRAFFKKFGSPHILQMTATPIPRSLALAFFGEFDVSVIDEMPAGRKPVITKILTEQELKKYKQWILTKIKQGQQVYVVTPLIEESDKLDDVKAVTQEYEEMKELFPEISEQICMLHGKMKPVEKDEIMRRFKEGKCKILVSTTVIEVGVDVPQATIMIIKNAERFGLAQLHQLRGRVGRSDLQSYCFLITKAKSGDTYKRLKAMEKYNDGFKLAELDLKFRGAGEFLGTRQSGASDIPVEVLSDIKFLEKVQQAAKWLLEKYPNLDGLPKLKDMLEKQDRNLLV